MGSTTGDFGRNPNHKQCTATSRRSGERCKGIAVATSTTQKCRMHGGNASAGTQGPSPKGRHSRYLPTDLSLLYEEARSNPDLLEMSDHIALLEGRIQQMLGEATAEGSIPRWSNVADMFAEVETAMLSGDMDKVGPALESMHKMLDNGKQWDTTWDRVQESMEQLRKLTDTEIKRKKELNQMVPVERVIILMAAVSQAVKRNVTDPKQIQAVQRELAILYGTNDVPARPDIKRVGARTTIDTDAIEVS